MSYILEFSIEAETDIQRLSNLVIKVYTKTRKITRRTVDQSQDRNR